MKLISVTLLALALASSSFSIVYTFDTSADLTDNFDLNVVPGDSNTHWQVGYGPNGGFEGSDGGFVHFNDYYTGNSIHFKSGPVFLNSFDLSSAYSDSGRGVNNAVAAENDFTLVLLDALSSVIFSQTFEVFPNGDWGTLNLGVANVQTIQILARANDGTGTGGWWPNIDNVVVDEIHGVPDSTSTLMLFALGLGAMCSVRRNLFAR